VPRFYRIVKANPPTQRDFLSYRAQGKTPPDDPELARRWEGLSAYESLRLAYRRARNRPQLGRFVAVLDVREGGPLRYERTGEGAGHWTLWGDPDAALACVESVMPVEGVHFEA
jgi:hypothetical protein